MTARQRWLLIAVAVLVAANIAYWIYSGWGLITIHADSRPLAEVIRSIERQGHATIRTNLPVDTQVSMNVDKVPLTEAMETLATVTESRWRLTYLVAGDKGTIANALGAFSSDQKLDDWRTIYYPMPSILDDEDRPPDPRRDTWTVKEPEDKTLQGYLDEAGRSVSASFTIPKEWNPPVSSKPSSGEIGSVVPKLVKAAKGQVQEIFLLQKNNRGDVADRGDGGDGGARAWMGGGGSREGMAQRIQAEIDKLPPDKRAAAQAEFDERKQFFAGLRDLPPDERRQKIQDFFERPDVQDKIEERSAKQDARRTPEQRAQRYRNYVNRKEQAKNGGSTK